MSDLPKNPIQPLVMVGESRDPVLRFKANAIVRDLLDYATPLGFGLNEIAVRNYTHDDRMQLAQLIGYSHDGAANLSYFTDEVLDAAMAAYVGEDPKDAMIDAQATRIMQLEATTAKTSDCLSVETSSSPKTTVADKILKVYIAGPDVFLPNAAVRFDAIKKYCQALDLEALVPFDNNEYTTSIEAVNSIYAKNIELIKQCDIVMANITPFRGTEPDSGTVFEIGFAAALGKPVVAYRYGNETVLDRTVRYFRHSLDEDFDTASQPGETVFPDGYRAEDFDLPVNLMLHKSTVFINGTVKEAIMYIDLRRDALMKKEA